MSVGCHMAIQKNGCVVVWSIALRRNKSQVSEKTVSRRTHPFFISNAFLTQPQCCLTFS